MLSTLHNAGLLPAIPRIVSASLTKKNELNISWISMHLPLRPANHYQVEIVISKSIDGLHKRQILRRSIITRHTFHVMKDFDAMATYNIRVRPENAVGRSKFSAPLQIHKRQAPIPSSGGGGLPPWAVAIIVLLVLLFFCLCSCCCYYLIIAACLLKHRGQHGGDVETTSDIYYQPGDAQEQPGDA